MKEKTKVYVLLKDIVIPAGTKLDSMPENKGGRGYVGCIVGVGQDFHGEFSVTVEGLEDATEQIAELI